MAIKILIGGSPCTYWSIAQKNNRETEASGMGWELFKNYLIAKEKFKPDFFLYENNKSAAQAIKDQIAEEFGVGVDPDVRFTYINSALVSAQNRQRFYVTNFGDIEQPEDRGILLKDILETGEDLTSNDKSYTLTASYNGAIPWNTIERNQRNMIVEPLEMIPPCGQRNQDKSRTITAGYTSASQRDFRMDIETDGFMGKQGVMESVRVGCMPSPDGEVKNSQAKRIYAVDGKSVNLVANGGGEGAKTGLYAVPVCHNIPQEVRVRKYTCDISRFQDCLRDHKHLNNREIAETLGKPLTEVEHWFRKDKYFNIPDPDIWFDLKNLLNIEATEYDDFVTVFEERQGVFEKSNRCYDVNGKMSTLMTGKTDNIIVPVPVNITNDGKSQTIKASYQQTSVANICKYTSTYGATGVAEPILSPENEMSLYALQVDEPMRVKEAAKQGYVDINVGDCVDLTQPNSKTRRGRSLAEKSNCLTTSHQQYEYCGVLGYATPCEWDENGIPTKAISCADGKTYTVYEVKDGQITIKGKQYPIKLIDGYYIIRKLTVRECARLQTMPDDYCKAVSDSQAYKALGNGWTAEVIIHLLNHALKDVPRDEEIVVLSMYDGIATGRYCLDKMGFTNVTYHAYEIDKYPIMVAMDNYPDIIQHGDAFAVREDDWKPPQTRSEWLDELLGA